VLVSPVKSTVPPRPELRLAAGRRILEQGRPAAQRDDRGAERAARVPEGGQAARVGRDGRRPGIADVVERREAAVACRYVGRARRRAVGEGELAAIAHDGDGGAGGRGIEECHEAVVGAQLCLARGGVLVEVERAAVLADEGRGAARAVVIEVDEGAGAACDDGCRPGRARIGKGRLAADVAGDRRTAGSGRVGEGRDGAIVGRDAGETGGVGVEDVEGGVVDHVTDDLALGRAVSHRRTYRSLGRSWWSGSYIWFQACSCRDQRARPPCRPHSRCR
jgi:hypothetical protein